MILIYLFTCFLQPICLPIPEMMTVLAATETYGGMLAFFVGLIGTLLGITVMYFMAKKGTNKITSRYSGKEGFLQIQEFIKRNSIMIAGLLLVIPVLPDEIVCVCAGVVNIPFRIFLPIALVSKSISIGMIAFSENIAGVLSISQVEILMIEILALMICTIICNRSFGLKKGDLME